MIHSSAIEAELRDAGMDAWADVLAQQIQQALAGDRHGDLGRWRHLLEQLPLIQSRDLDLAADRLRIGRKEELDAETRKHIHQSLRALQPWRKGPYEVFGIHIDTEWRSDWKWQRLINHIQPLHGRRVLDVGCGSGYHAWRMAGEGAQLVIGIDPSLLFLAQFNAIRHFMAQPPNVHFLPLGIETVPENLSAFDSVFSMGILYHRRSPLDHLADLKSCLRPGGELVLETLVVEGDENTVLLPKGRYAKMRNVWFIPSTAALEIWLYRCGYKAVQVVDVTPTSTGEQRRTDWMAFESLEDFLDPDDRTVTVEGYPAPVRAVVLATA
ncbi:tRNA 5-methoxyuridine(34)/uridine 5-oxyacetic acid(34) synthase CmoB [Thiolapillus brandeum]|uniref:tRNA U34 carboxymethyltransferase n=1 Tax=Thiolapillus brandeum TaxID=1076588 RepID=A0A7U6GIQ5_9GAMM|nr:tRNA 5-methoxyuridine(34)/uridine 5-oxyacetic acid(34) synthase CmoB [Thiolapillus brandeum]BAO44401.1 methyltransferase [Thiolapillus brandeum]